MSKFIPPDYNGIEAGRWRKNADDVLPRLQSRDKYLLKTIERFSRQFGYTKTEIEEKIKSDEKFAAWFAKQPGRQGIHEKIAEEWLNQNLGVKVEKLPTSGKDAWYMDEGGKFVRWTEKGEPPSKSMDFKWNFGGITYFAMHKHTSGDGGGQDQSRKEIFKMLQMFSKAQDETKVFIAIADGSHYTPDRMATLKKQTSRTPPSYVVPIEEVPAIIGITDLKAC